MLDYNNNNPGGFVFVFERTFNNLYKYICKNNVFRKCFLFRNILKLYFLKFIFHTNILK
jgi:hypothetical protein